MGGGGEKTERATPKRRRDERKKGNVFKSQEIILLLSLLAVMYSFQFAGSMLIGMLTNSMESFFGEAGWRLSIGQDVPNILVQCLFVLAICAGIPLVVSMLASILGTIAQTRGLVSFASMKPKFSKLSPLNGIKKMFSLRGLIELFKSILKIVVLGFVIYNQYMERFEEFPRLMDMEFSQVLYYCADFIMSIVTTVAIIFAVIAAADYLYQRWQYERDMRMTKQEIKEEFKQTEGDPQIKGKIRQKQQQMAMRRMMQKVPEADVVIRNPTHYAVAIRYEAGKNNAPLVLAKGADLIALRIIKTAEDAGVAVYEDRPLARNLYENVPLDREIPQSFFQPVAEVLAFVYSAAKKKKPRRASPVPASPRPNGKDRV